LNLPGELAEARGPACLPCLRELLRKLPCHTLAAVPCPVCPSCSLALPRGWFCQGEGTAVSLDPAHAESEPPLVRAQHFPLGGWGGRGAQSLSPGACLSSSASKKRFPRGDPSLWSPSPRGHDGEQQAADHVRRLQFWQSSHIWQIHPVDLHL